MFNKKSVITAIVTSIASLLVAATASAINGPYIGGALGYGNIYQSQVLANEDGVTGGKGGLAGRIFGGYEFTQFLAAEMGYTKFSNNSVTAYVNTPAFGKLTGPQTIKSYAVDLVAKATLPLQDGFNLFGKLGAAYLNEQTTSNTVVSNSAGDVLGLGKNTYDRILPTFGLGLGYDLSKNVSTDVSWMRIQKTSSSTMQSTDTVMLGLSYHFN